MNALSKILFASLTSASLALACSTGPSDGAGSLSNADTDLAVTFNKQIMPLVQEHCQDCHHDGGIAPMPFMDYAQTKRWASAIKADVVSHKMPHARPVRVDTGCSTADTFLGARRLSPDEIATFVKWVDTGAVEGDAADLPPPKEFHDPVPGEWITGTPDLIVENTADGFNIPAHVPRDIFRRFPIQTSYDEDKYVTSFEAHPDNGVWSGMPGHFPVVHHMELWIDRSGESVRQERDYQAQHPDIPGPGFEGEWDFADTPLLLGMWIPGSDPPAIPAGYGYKLPKGAVLVFEIHYAGDRVNDVPVNDHSHVGIHFSSGPVKPFTSLVQRNENFSVPANVKGTTAGWSYTFDRAVDLRGITPHMHQLGSDYRLVIERPGQADSCLADVEWDFEHQNAYFLKQPAKLPAGSTLKWTCTYNNTASAPRQFNNPVIDIKSGRTSRDEMCQLTMHWTDTE